MDLHEYLNNNINDKKEIYNTEKFYKVFNSLSDLYKNIGVTFNVNNNKILRSQGKYNAKICFVFKNEDHYKATLKLLNRIFPVYDINIWDILVLYVDKFDDYNVNINILKKELDIINPCIVYFFDIPNNVTSNKVVNVNNLKDLLDNNSSAEIFDLFEYLITYNN